MTNERLLIDAFAVDPAVDLRPTDREISRNGVRTGVSVPAQDLESWILGILRTTSAETSISSFTKLSDLSGVSGSWVFGRFCQLSSQSGSALFAVRDTNNGLQLYLTGDTGSGVTSIPATATFHPLKIGLIMLDSAGNAKHSTDDGVTFSAAWSGLQDVGVIDDWSSDSGRFFAFGSNNIRVYTSLANAANNVPLTSRTCTGVNCGASGPNGALFANSSTGVVRFAKLNTAGNNFDWFNYTFDFGVGFTMKPVILYANGSFWIKASDGASIKWFRSSGYDSLVEVTGRNVQLDDATIPMVVGSLLLDVGADDGYLYYSRDAQTWTRLLNPADYSATAVSVGNRLILVGATAATTYVSGVL